MEYNSDPNRGSTFFDSFSSFEGDKPHPDVTDFIDLHALLSGVQTPRFRCENHKILKKPTR